MERNAFRAAFALVFVLAGVITTNGQRDYRDQSLDLLRFLATKPWAGRGHNRWDRAPRFDADITDAYGAMGRWPIKPKTQDDSANYVDDEDLKMDTATTGEDFPSKTPKTWGESVKRSAVATVINGRRRRQPSPALGVLNDVNFFFDSLRENLQGLNSLTPQQRAKLFTEVPSVVEAPSSNGGGGGTGMRRLHALRPLRPTGNIRTYNRRSFVEPEDPYPNANHHDPGLLWTGLGRR